MDILEEPENQRVLLDLKVMKKMIFCESRLELAMQGRILLLRVGVQKSIWSFLWSPKIRE